MQFYQNGGVKFIRFRMHGKPRLWAKLHAAAKAHAKTEAVALQKIARKK